MRSRLVSLLYDYSRPWKGRYNGPAWLIKAHKIIIPPLTRDLSTYFRIFDLG